MAAPFFSIVIPTKNRSLVVGGAIQSALRQTFSDIEVVVVDNDDSDATTKVVGSFQDRRLRHIRTGGLSMPDNWERAATAGRGEYVCFLEDKQVYKGRTLERVYQQVERDRCESVRWLHDIFDDTTQQTAVTRVRGQQRVHELSSESVLERLVSGPLWDAVRLMPIPHQSAIHRNLLARIERGPVQRLCPPVSPDLNLAIQQLAFTDSVLLFEEALVVTTVLHSNGRNFMFKTGLERQFTTEIGGEALFYDQTPIKVVMVENCMYNDYLTLQKAVQGRLLRFPLNWVNYFAECHRAIMRQQSAGVNMEPELAAWKAALEQQPLPLVRAVYGAMTARKPLWVLRGQAALKQFRQRTGILDLEHSVRDVFRRLRGKPDKHLTGRFPTPLDYAEWDDQQPMNG